ncbi:MAG TPA: cadherin domain-containing protein, partial [Pirellulaceae bacterium]
ANLNDGILISGATAANNFVEGNRIGTNATGTAALGNATYGVRVTNAASDNSIGEAIAGAGNLISGNAFAGIHLDGVDNTWILGNFIGTNAAGTSAIANGGQGVNIQGGSGHLVGSGSATARNLISGNNSFGVLIGGANSVSVAGNLIGTDLQGLNAVANLDGVVLENSANNVVGGTTAAERNLIAGNVYYGIIVTGAASTANQINGNHIGLDATGSVALANGADGVYLNSGAHDNTIGGLSSGAGNVISGNAGRGIALVDSGTSGNLFLGNYIGTDASGTAGLGNASHGIEIDSFASGNSVGGTVAGAGNVIAFNSGSGVVLSSTAGSGNAILGNRIFSNLGLGIDLNHDGITLNDAGDSDVGPNDLQNFPVLTVVATDGSSVHLEGTLNGLMGTNYRLEFFVDGVGDASGYGEAERFLGVLNLSTDATGHATFSVDFAVAVAVGERVTATATDPVGNTSEFGLHLAATDFSPLLDLDADNSSGQIGADYATTYIEGAAAVLIADSDAIVSDPNSGFLSSLVVTITNLLDGVSEFLTADTTSTLISASFVGGVLTLNGVDSEANYQQVLRTVRYGNSSGNPNTATRVVTFQASDGTLTSLLATTTVQVVAVNAPPSITSDGGAPTANIAVNENSTLVTQVTATDAEVPGQTLTYSIAGGADLGRFTLNASSGQLQFTVAPDREVPIDNDGDNIYEVLVQVDDGVGGTDNQLILVTVSDVNEFNVTSISDSDPTANAVSETTTNGTSVGITSSALDADATDFVAYSLDDDAG